MNDRVNEFLVSEMRSCGRHAGSMQLQFGRRSVVHQRSSRFITITNPGAQGCQRSVSLQENGAPGEREREGPM